MTDRISGSFRKAAKILITLVVAGLFLGSFRLVPWARPAWQPILINVLPIPELFVLFAAGLITKGIIRRPGPKMLLGLYIGVLIVWNAGEFIYRWNYRDHFQLLDDLALLPGLLTMITRLPWFRSVFGGIITYAITLVILTSLGSILLTLSRWTGREFKGGRLNTVIAGMVLFSAGLVQAVVFPGDTPTIMLVRSLLERETGRNTEIVRESPYPSFTDEELLKAQRTFELTEEEQNYSFRGIADGDIHLIVVESYGHTLFTNRVHRENIAPVYAESGRQLTEMGWNAASGFLDSPAYGGRSWLADATLITGKRMSNQKIFDDHIYSSDPNLSGLMGAAGYHTVYAAPGTRRTPDDWKDYYNYDEYLIEGTMGWNGPFISFGEMSDQYFLDYVGRQYSEMEQPLFLTALLVSSHVPFVRIPEYFEDWDRLGDGTIYRNEGIRKFNNNWLTGSEYPEGYVYSIEYVMKSIIGYIERYVDDDALVIVVGDHQPRIPISETTAGSGVPIHFLTRSALRLKPLFSQGLSSGFVPEDDLDIRPMEDFPEILNSVLQPRGALSQYMRKFR